MVLFRGLSGFIADTSSLSCEPWGIPQKELQIARTVTNYFNDVIRKISLTVGTRGETVTTMRMTV